MSEEPLPSVPQRAEGADDQGALEVLVEGGFVAELRVVGAPQSETVRATINQALLAWYEREDAARAALDAALERAAGLETPTLIGQASLPDPPSWVEPVARFLEDGPGGADRSQDPQ